MARLWRARMLLLAAVATGYASRARPARRAVLAAAMPMLLKAPAARALELALPAGGSIPLSLSFGGPKVELVSQPSVCQGRCRDQDFVVVRYTARRAGGGAAFDERYAKTPLVYELGSFYLPGVDEALDGACVGSTFRMSWPRSPALGGEADAVLPPGTPIEMDLELVTIKYSLFGEKMRNASSTYWFNPLPLTLTSAPDSRGHKSARIPIVTKDNPFSIAPGEKSVISNPSSVLSPLFKGLL